LSDTDRSVARQIRTVSYGHDDLVEIEIDYDAPESPHRQIAAWLRGKIESGEIQPGRKLPSEKDIMDLTGVARTTARRAVKVLQDEGLVVTTPGRGTHVTKRLSREPDLHQRLTERVIGAVSHLCRLRMKLAGISPEWLT
jgi:DNA-binding GntR family transcriptional regulator